MLHQITTEWRGGMAFDNRIGRHNLRIDDNSEEGGKSGPNPKILILTSLAGCTGMDVIALLQKMRVPLKKFYMNIYAETASAHPKVYTRMHVDYYFSGENIKSDKTIKAVRLSQERYCGVSAMIRMICPLTYSIFINDIPVLENEPSKSEQPDPPQTGTQ